MTDKIVIELDVGEVLTISTVKKIEELGFKFRFYIQKVKED